MSQQRRFFPICLKSAHLDGDKFPRVETNELLAKRPIIYGAARQVPEEGCLHNSEGTPSLSAENRTCLSLKSSFKIFHMATPWDFHLR